MPKKRIYRTSVTVGHKPDGEAITKYPSASSKPKLREKVKELRRVHGAGGPGALADVLVRDYSRKWLDGRAGEIDNNTALTYRGYIDNDINPYWGDMQVQSVLPSDCKLAMAKNKDLAPGTYNMVVMLIKAIFRQAVEDGICIKNPASCLKRVRDYEQKRRALTGDETNATLEYISSCPGTDAAKALALFYYCGIRRGEGFGLQWKHIDFKARKVSIAQQLRYVAGGGGEISTKLKTRNSYRDIPIPQQLYDALYPFRGLPGVYVFQFQGSHYRPCDVEDLWESIKNECPALAEISFHYFRHNFATLMYLDAEMRNRPKESAAIFGDTVREMLETYAHIENDLHLIREIATCNIFPTVAKS